METAQAQFKFYNELIFPAAVPLQTRYLSTGTLPYPIHNAAVHYLLYRISRFRGPVILLQSRSATPEARLLDDRVLESRPIRASTNRSWSTCSPSAGSLGFLLLHTASVRRASDGYSATLYTFALSELVGDPGFCFSKRFRCCACGFTSVLFRSKIMNGHRRSTVVNGCGGLVVSYRWIHAKCGTRPLRS